MPKGAKANSEMNTCLVINAPQATNGYSSKHLNVHLQSIWEKLNTTKAIALIAAITHKAGDCQSYNPRAIHSL